jgi:DNA-binding beta-propeller fold protein YncE
MTRTSARSRRALILVAGLVILGATAAAQRHADQVPTFEYDPSWPKQLPNNWIIGPVGALYIDGSDHVWMVQRPGGTTNLSERYGLKGFSECCFPAPPVIEFDTAGNVVQAWGPIHGAKGELLGKQVSGPYPEGAWPISEHGIFVDAARNVWVDSSTAPSTLLKLTADGKLLLQIGKRDAKTSSDTINLGGPTGILVDTKRNEVYVADGYLDRRVIVFDATTGTYKRHWGAYGKPPIEEQAPGTNEDAVFDPKERQQQFDHVHCLVQDKDGLLYVCDRANDRFQVFKTDGTFVREAFVAPNTRGFGSIMGLAFSPDQTFMYVADGANHKVWILRRDTLNVVGSFGGSGRGGGQMLVLHAIATDSKGNIYLGETLPGNRVQRFVVKGGAPR